MGTISQGVRECKQKNSQNEPKNQFLAQVGPFLNNSKNCSISDAASCLSSLVKNIGCFWGVLAKNPKAAKMTVSAGTKTFKNLKLDNCRSHISKTCPACVPP